MLKTAGKCFWGWTFFLFAAPLVAAMNSSQPKSIMEPNAIFWLEFRQAKRNGFLFGLLACGVIAPLLFGWWLPFYFGWKIASERINEDMILYTPLTPYQVLNGKIMFGLLCGLLISTPPLFMALLMEDFFWLLDAIDAFLILQYKTIVVIGFMAGAISLSRTVTLAFLLGVLGIAVFTIYRLFDVFPIVATILLGLPTAIFAYFVGISGLSSNLKRRKSIAWSLTAIFTFCFVVAFWYSLCENFSDYAWSITILLFLYFAPLIVVASLGGVFRETSNNKLPG